MMPPTVYIMPPARSHKKEVLVKLFKRFVKASTQVHPILIYKTEDIHLGQVTQNALRMMPPIAIPQTVKRSG